MAQAAALQSPRPPSLPPTQQTSGKITLRLAAQSDILTPEKVAEEKLPAARGPVVDKVECALIEFPVMNRCHKHHVVVSVQELLILACGLTSQNS